MRVKESWNRMPLWALQQENWADRLLHCCCRYVWSSLPFISPAPLSGDQREKMSIRCSCPRPRSWEVRREHNCCVHASGDSIVKTLLHYKFQFWPLCKGIWLVCMSVFLGLPTTVLVLFKDFYLLAWTCIWQDTQASRRLVPSSPMWELLGGGSELQAPTLKHISGISGRVRLPWWGKGEKCILEEAPSFDNYRDRKKERKEWINATTAGFSYIRS